MPERKGAGLVFTPEMVQVRDGSGTRVAYTVATCGACQEISFVVLYIPGQASPHVQCMACGVIYCLGHCCVKEEG